MALPVRDQLRYWGIAAAVFFALLWALGDVLLPFVVGGAIAYLLDPLADRLERLGLGRAAATTVISLVALTAVVLAVLLVVPAVVRQGAALAEAMPGILRQLLAFLSDRFPALIEADSPLRQSIAGLGDTLRDRGLALVNTVLSSALGVINFFVFLLVVPVVAFYLLLDWDRLVGVVDRLLPLDHAPAIRRLANDIDGVLAGFVRGQLSVCATLAVYYAGALMLAGLQYGLVVGVVAGMISFIPYIGAIVGGGLAIGLALFQFWGAPAMIAAVAAIFALGQFLEGNVLVPRLVGNSVGLHPVWLLLALSVFGSLFGFVGMLIAVPVAAAIGVLARFGVERYSGSLLYRGLSGRGDGEAG
jgi:predicted PurR-regulated permease PerM